MSSEIVSQEYELCFLFWNQPVRSNNNHVDVQGHRLTKPLPKGVWDFCLDIWASIPLSLFVSFCLFLRPVAAASLSQNTGLCPIREFGASQESLLERMPLCQTVIAFLDRSPIVVHHVLVCHIMQFSFTSNGIRKGGSLARQSRIPKMGIVASESALPLQ